MEDPYQRFLTSMSRATPHPIAGFQGFPHEHFAPVPAATIPIGGQPPSESSPPSSSGYQEGQIPGGSDGSSSKGRKKSATAIATGDIVKHRRTRSGCFTCRSRRVKCDEKRPTCERCSKGNRECVYPDPPSRKGSGASRTSRSKEADKSRSPPTAGSTENDSDNRSKLQTIPDQEEPGDKSQASSSHPSSNITATPPGISGVSGRHGSETPSQESRSSPSNSTAASSGFATVPYDPSDFPSPSAGTPDWTNLTPEYQRHLTWYYENITHWHYGLNHDNEDFFTVILPQAAVQNQALLNAVVGFAAYEATIENPDGKVEEFLPYYNNSVSLLLDFLRRKEKHNVYTLMTILQLAQIEEYLGDWVNILGHQKAAHEIFTKLFTPQNVMDTPVGRMCLNWYARFDGFMAFMGSFPHDLSKEYAQAASEYNRAQVAKHPGDVNFLIVDRYSQLRLVSWQLAVCYARRNRGQLSMAEYCQEHRRLTDALHEYKDNWQPALTDPNFLITDFGGQQPEPDSIVNPFEPGLLYDFPLFNTTVSAAEWHSLVIIHTMLSPNKPLEEMFTEIKEHALTIARYWDTVKYWPHTPKGVLLHLKAILSTAGMCLPKDKKYENWVRRNFLVCESTGAIRAESHRKKIAEAFNDPTLVHWWLPNDEGFTPVLRRLREFADERNAAASTVQQEAVREAKQLFSKFKEMSLEESTEDTP